jgi:hypothetical protein
MDVGSCGGGVVVGARVCRLGWVHKSAWPAQVRGRWGACMSLMVGARVCCVAWLGTWGRSVGHAGVDQGGSSDGQMTNHLM